MTNNTESQLVTVAESEGVLEVCLESPPWNILDHPMIDELEQAISATDEQGVGAILLRASGKGFCSGVSIEDHLPDRVERMLDRFRDILVRIHQSPVPTVGVVTGVALGGGLELACALDVLFAAEGTRLGQPEIKLAAIAPAALHFLPRRVGFNRAADLLFSGRTVTAEQGAGWGLVDFVLPRDTVEEEARRYARRIAAYSRPIMRACKAGLLKVAELTTSEFDEMNRLYLDRVASESDSLEGLTAFMENRKPVWKEGRS